MTHTVQDLKTKLDKCLTPINELIDVLSDQSDYIIPNREWFTEQFQNLPLFDRTFLENIKEFKHALEVDLQSLEQAELDKQKITLESKTLALQTKLQQVNEYKKTCDKQINALLTLKQDIYEYGFALCKDEFAEILGLSSEQKAQWVAATNNHCLATQSSYISPRGWQAWIKQSALEKAAMDMLAQPLHNLLVNVLPIQLEEANNELAKLALEQSALEKEQALLNEKQAEIKAYKEMITSLDEFLPKFEVYMSKINEMRSLYASATAATDTTNDDAPYKTNKSEKFVISMIHDLIDLLQAAQSFLSVVIDVATLLNLPELAKSATKSSIKIQEAIDKQKQNIYEIESGKRNDSRKDNKYPHPVYHSLRDEDKEAKDKMPEGEKKSNEASSSPVKTAKPQ